MLSELGELTVDLLTTSDVARELPVVGWALKVVKALDDIRSRLLAQKNAKFVLEPSLVTAAEARKMRGRLDQDDEYAQELGETLLMVLDKVTDMSKPGLLARAYAAYRDEVIGRNELLSLTHAVDISSSVDWGAGFGLLEDGDDLAIGKAGRLHVELLVS